VLFPYFLFVFISIVSFLYPVSASSNDFIGKVVKIVDGDTFDVQTESEKIRIRFYGIDCPEKDQPYGLRAKEIAMNLASGRKVVIRKRGRGIGKFGRTIGDVILPDGKNMSHMLVQAGACWWYQKYAPGDEELKKLENEARNGKSGLWNKDNPVPPWIWRKRRRQ
jgi:micrococcal nuclease